MIYSPDDLKKKINTYSNYCSQNRFREYTQAAIIEFIIVVCK